MQQDLRWKQRFSNFKKAVVSLEVGGKLFAVSGLSELEKQGVIQGFEFTHELSWKVMQDFLKEKGETSIYGSKDATRLAFNRGLISNGEGWVGMIKDRNLSSDTYQEEVAEKIFNNIVDIYYPLFKQFEVKMDELNFTD